MTRPMRARGGFTLVEAMLAGSIAILLTLSLLEGFIVAAKISHENSELLAAEAYAWDVAWKWLNKSYADLPEIAAGYTYDSGSNPLIVIDEEDCPMISAARAGGDPRLVVRVVTCAGTTAVQRNGVAVEAKRIDVDVAWGPVGDRKSLNGLAESSAKSYNIPISVYKAPIDRGLEGTL